MPRAFPPPSPAAGDTALLKPEAPPAQDGHVFGQTLTENTQTAVHSPHTLFCTAQSRTTLPVSGSQKVL